MKTSTIGETSLFRKHFEKVFWELYTVLYPISTKILLRIKLNVEISFVEISKFVEILSFYYFLDIPHKRTHM